MGYRDIDDFFRKNPVTPYVVLAREVGVAYQTISRNHKKWMKRQEAKDVTVV